MPNDQTLKLELAKLLPDKIVSMNHDGRTIYCWIREKVTNINLAIQETEWLHVCWLIEHAFEYEEKHNFIRHLYSQPEFGCVADYTGSTDYDELFVYIHASWQQRAMAILMVKGIEA